MEKLRDSSRLRGGFGGRLYHEGAKNRLFFNIFFTAETRSPQRIPLSPFFLCELRVSAVRFFWIAAGLIRVHPRSSVVSFIARDLSGEGEMCESRGSSRNSVSI